MATVPGTNQKPEQTSLLGKVFSRVAHWLAQELISARQRPIRSMLILSGVGVLIIAAPVTFYVLYPRVDAPETILVQGLHALDQRNYAEARRKAMQLRNKKLAWNQLGGPVFLFGASIAQEARKEKDERERKKLFQLAARYLRDAEDRGFPPGRQGEGTFLLGRCFSEIGEFSKAIPYLKNSIQLRKSNRPETYRRLTEAFQRQTHPDLAAAQKYLRLYLAEPSLTAEEKEFGELERVQILIGLNQADLARAGLEQIDNSSPAYGKSLVLHGELELGVGKQIQGEGQDGTSHFRQALKYLEQAPAYEANNEQLMRQAQLLIGLCYMELGDLSAAQAQFLRTRQLDFETDEGIAATLYEAEVARKLGQDAAAVDLYELVLREAGSADSYQNRWVPIDQFQHQIETAYTEYRASRNYDAAIRLANAFYPMFHRAYSVRLRAEAQEEWGKQLALQAAEQSPYEAEALQSQSRFHFRKAGSLYDQLAELRKATRNYRNDLWTSSENYFRGHDFKNVIYVLEKYLEDRPRDRLPSALLQMGESQLALGDVEGALRSFKDCVTLYPRHPASYRARLMAATANMELEEALEAEQLLVANLNNEALTPKSLEWRDSLFALGEVLYKQAVQEMVKGKSFNSGVAQDEVTDEQPLDLGSEETSEDAVAIAQMHPLEKSHKLFGQAALKLSEAVERYPSAPQVTDARYMLAQSYRHQARWPEHRRKTVHIESTRARLNREIESLLTAAIEQYQSLRDALNQKQEKGYLGDVEQAVLRNCYFAIADALFELGEYEEAIAAYTTTTARYHGDPSTLEAFVQIARCFRELNRPTEAKGTLAQAKVVLSRIPEEADFSATTRNDRQGWIQLLDFLSEL
jgi:TolA-binding protein